MAIVSIKSQQITFYDADGWILKAPVSTGVRGRETPAGVFSVLQKNIDHRSNLYDDAHMPHMQRLTWNGIAMHGGPLPGYAASHGCVRLPFGFAERLFDKTRLGMRVIISPQDAVPADFSHPSLLVPNADAVATAPERAEALARESDEAAKAADETKKAAAKAAKEAAASKTLLRKLEGQKSAAERSLADAEKAVAKAEKAVADAEKAPASEKADKARARAGENQLRAEELRNKAAAKAADASAKLEAAKTDAQPKIDAATQAQDAAKAAASKKPEAAKAAAEAKLLLEPVSIYISRATQMVYVRRNTRNPWPDGGEVYDATIEAPVTILDPERPIGTHVFTAMATNGEGLRWSAVTIDHGDEAKAALDRISIPEDVLNRIAPTALPRSSIVISDEPLSRETNYRTEFVAVLSNQPQGGFKTRKPTPPRPKDFWDGGGGGGGFFSFFDPPPAQAQRSGKPRRRTQVQKGFWW